jgi:hypothetical protein
MNDINDSAAHARIIGSLVARSAAQSRFHRIKQIMRSRQAADMGGQNAVALAHAFLPAAVL